MSCSLLMLVYIYSMEPKIQLILVATLLDLSKYILRLIYPVYF